jgi:hypothetical protein
MCRFNLILIRDEKAKELLEREGYSKMYDNLNGYMAYQKGYCNCGSFVGSMVDKKGMDYQDVINLRKAEKLDELYQIQKLMNQPNYKVLKEEFLQKQTELSNEMNVFYKSINDYELQQSDFLLQNYNGEELNHEMDNLNNEVTKMLTSLDSNPAYKVKNDAYITFLEKNHIMNLSTIYYLSKEEEGNTIKNTIPISDILEMETETILDENYFDDTIIEIEEDSQVISEVIRRTKNNDTYSKNLDEYNDFYNIITKLLNIVPFVKFSTIWSEPNDLKEIKTVNIQSLKIDDLAFLDFDEMICITK